MAFARLSARSDLTQDALRELIDYDPLTGIFTWRPRDSRYFTRDEDCARWNARDAGHPAGTVVRRRDRHYLEIKLLYRAYYGHRLAMFYVTGVWPRLVDHIDNDGLNNRWSNLRAADGSENNANSRRRSDNTSGFKGVSFKQREGKYAASITRGHKRTMIGLFATPEEAHAAYRAAAEECYGAFARL